MRSSWGVNRLVLERIQRVTARQAVILIAAVGVAVYWSGLTSPFQGDDISQIVNNPVVHSITHIGTFFNGSTFYTGAGTKPLSGSYYRPLMTVVFSLLYTLFGAHTLPYHIVQLLLGIGSAYLLYLLFRYSLRALPALVLAIIFLVHPLNSQVLFAIPSMQDALFVFFGLLALWLLLRFNSVRSLIGVALCLFVSALSKEMGAVFVILSGLYLFWFNRKRLAPFLIVMIVPIVLYLVLKVHAVGFSGKTNIAPIDSASIGARLLTMPSVLLFYIEKFIFPWKLASGYYWVYRSFSVVHVLLPLIADLLVIGFLFGMGALVHMRLSKAQYYTYLFFAVWTVIGIVPYLQILPLDMTACETWFYFAMAGLLGMIGMMWLTIQPHIKPVWLLAAIVLVIGALSVRTASRGLIWERPETLARTDIAVSPDDYNANYILAGYLIKQGRFSQAKTYAQDSVNLYPTYNNYNNLGLAMTGLGNYSAAVDAYDHALHYSDYPAVVENLGLLALLTGTYTVQKQLLSIALKNYPQDAKLWIYLAIVEQRGGDAADAKTAIAQAQSYGSVSSNVYQGIINNQPFVFPLTGINRSIYVP